MDIALLIVHSFLRWFLLIAIISSVYMSFRGWINNTPFSNKDAVTGKLTTILAHIQLLIGILAYVSGGTLSTLASNFSNAIQDKEFRFFALEHSFLMLLAIAFITIGSVKSGKKTADQDRHKTLAIWFSIGLILMLIAIPWPFSPFAVRPWLRVF